MAQTKWQSIETAPRDGKRRILAIDVRSGLCHVVIWDPHSDRWLLALRSPSIVFDANVFTHWRPIMKVSEGMRPPERDEIPEDLSPMAKPAADLLKQISDRFKKGEA